MGFEIWQIQINTFHRLVLMESCLQWCGRLLYDVNWQNDRSQLLGGMWFLSFTDNTTMFRNFHKCQKHHKNWTIQIDTPMTLNKVSHQNFLFFLNIAGKCCLPTSSLDLKATPCVGGVCVNPFHVVLNRITSVWWEDTVCKFLAINIPLWHFGNMKAETLHFLEIAPLVQIYINIYRWHCNKTFQWLPISKNSIAMIRNSQARLFLENLVEKLKTQDNEPATLGVLWDWEQELWICFCKLTCGSWGLEE